MRRPRERRKPQAEHVVHVRSGVEMRLLGLVLIAVGLVLLFLSIPGWAWAALIGAGLVVIGWMLVK